MNKEESEAMAGYEEEMKREIDEQSKKDNMVMESVKKIVSEEIFKYILEELEESGGGYNFEIVEKPLGENQDCEKYEFWVNQTENGGYTGDCFSGSCYFKISENKYLEYDYSM